MSNFSDKSPQEVPFYEQAERMVDPSLFVLRKISGAFQIRSEALSRENAGEEPDDPELIRDLLHRDEGYMDAVRELDVARTEAVEAMARFLLADQNVQIVRQTAEERITDVLISRNQLEAATEITSADIPADKKGQ